MTFFSDDCVHSTTTSGFDALIAFRIVRHLDARAAGRHRHVAHIPADLGGIDVHAAHDAEAAARGDLPHDGRSDRPEAEVQDADGAFP